ncbi:hypothetical protein B0J11DRAFT_533617 [Dendryphion nanum]|uniref:Bacteriophage T5 Orf172 DNA-binding domain-containing protein n=1 Tax=Dendryphion nanum TaxID=256645 RepID=A0A9P9DMC1_9PLEO|nr:hypothetical protein B0J11DRAFT_533617 [Dendryphion nanum]
MAEQSSYLPGRFPSPTPSLRGNDSQSKNQPSSPLLNRTTTPSSRRPEAAGTSNRFPVDFTAPAFIQQRPIISASQSEDTVRHTQHQIGESAFDRRHLETTPTRSPITRPTMIRKRVVSDTRHNRLKQFHASSHTDGGSGILSKRRRVSTGGKDTKSSTDHISQPGTPSHFAQELHESLKCKIRKDFTPSADKGVVYILRDPKRHSLLKIGSSINIRQRRENIQRKCGLELEVVYISDEIHDYFRAEILTHEDLKPFARPYTCICGTEHREWHEVSEKVAKDTVHRWVAFMQTKPYTQAGKLEGLWDHLLTQRSSALRFRDIIDHDTLRNHWNLILSVPSWLDQAKYLLHCLQNHQLWWYLWQFSWQVSTVLSWLVTFVVVWNRFSFAVLLLHITCSSVSFASRRPVKK